MEGEAASDRVRAVAMLVLALVVPVAAPTRVARGDRLAGLAEALDPARWRRHDLVEIVLAALLAATLVAAIHVALGLVFDPRYKDFPFRRARGPGDRPRGPCLRHRARAIKPGRPRSRQRSC